MGKQWKQWETLFSWAPKSLQMVPAATKLKDACSLEEVVTNLDSVLKRRDITLPTKVHIVKVTVFPVVMYECKKPEHQRKNWCFSTVVPEKTLQSPLDGKEIKPVNPKGNQSWIFIGRTVTEAEAPILWQRGIWKNPGSGKDWRQKEKGTTEDEMFRWHHQLSEHEFE